MTVAVSIRDAGKCRWLELTAPAEVLQAERPDDVPGVIAAAEQAAVGRGLLAVGFVTYEASPGFEPRHTAHLPAHLPPAWFALFLPATGSAPVACSSAQAPDLDWRPTINAADYRRKVSAIRRYIAAGDSYQVNLSYRLRAALGGVTAGRQLFHTMIERQPAGYGAWIETDAWAIASASHELFFSRRGRRLTSRPMKGTAARGRSAAEDAERARWLAASEKNRAENLMITDMVRSDLGRLATVGSVRTERLFALESYPTLWQMTSTVTAESGATLAEVFAALFPAASITGAPKRRTMEIIHELEDDPREIYTGAIGFIEPGGDAQFNVAIRTAWVDKVRGCVEYGVGGGIVWDSQPDDEYQETRTKSRILATSRAAAVSEPASAIASSDTTPSPPIPGSAAPLPARDEFALLETLRWEPAEGYFLLERHLDRLRQSAARFGRRFDETALRARLQQLARTLPRTVVRIRVLVDAAGSVTIEHAPLDAAARPATVVLARSSSPVLDDPFVMNKTTHRSLYEQARLAGLRCAADAGDVLLRNERGEVTESTIANLVADVDGALVTPPAAAGLLPGVYRQHLLESGLITERTLHPHDVQSARALYLVNALRGMWRVRLLSSSSQAHQEER